MTGAWILPGFPVAAHGRQGKAQKQSTNDSGKARGTPSKVQGQKKEYWGHGNTSASFIILFRIGFGLLLMEKNMQGKNKTQRSPLTLENRDHLWQSVQLSIT